MDGHASNHPLFEQALTRIVGSYSLDLKLPVVSFISVRAHYAELVNTLVAGVRLQGRLKITEVLEKLDEGAHGAPQTLPSTQQIDRMYSTADVMSLLGDVKMTQAMVLPGDTHTHTHIHTHTHTHTQSHTHTHLSFPYNTHLHTPHTPIHTHTPSIYPNTPLSIQTPLYLSKHPSIHAHAHLITHTTYPQSTYPFIAFSKSITPPLTSPCLATTSATLH